MAGVGEFYYELRVTRRGDAAADEATLRRVSIIKKLQEHARGRHPDRAGARDAEPARDGLRCEEAQERGLERPRPGNTCRGRPASHRPPLKS